MLLDALKNEQAENIVVVCGGIIPEQDIPDLTDAGVGAVFGPGTNIAKAAMEVLDLID
jgi:methylmalonyl-CoA mutase